MKRGEPGESANRTSRPSAGAWVLAVLLLTGLYLASVGPFVALQQNGVIPLRFAEFCESTIYFPLMWLDLNTRFFEENPVGTSYASYIEWCEDVVAGD